MGSRRESERELDAQINAASGNEVPRKVHPLFVGGCARSGTTAFAEYLNQHEEILLCLERYKGRQRQVSWDLFSFERIMDFRPQETQRPPGGSLERFKERHAKLLARKNPAKLRWLGDKGPFYVRYMTRLAAKNPGARFIMLYRPLDEVAESWEARARNPNDPWRDERGAKESVNIWNLAMQGMREFIESSPAPRVLIIDYHDFFRRNEMVVPQISRFLDLQFSESLTQAWRDRSREFENARRSKELLSEEQREFIEGHADRDAEAWVLDRIESQWSAPELYVEQSEEAALASFNETEAEMWRLWNRVQVLERRLARERRQRRLKETHGSEREKAEHSGKKLEGRQDPEPRRLLDRLRRITRSAPF